METLMAGAGSSATLGVCTIVGTWILLGICLAWIELRK